MSIGAIGRTMNFRRFLNRFNVPLDWLDLIQNADSIRAAVGNLRGERERHVSNLMASAKLLRRSSVGAQDYTYLDSHSNSQSVLDGELRSNVADNYLLREKQT
jgi:hypothetical protein